MQKTYILKVERPNIGKEPGDYYNGEYGSSPEDIKRLLEKGIIIEEGTNINMENNESKLLSGFFFERPREGAPAFVKGRMSIQVEKAVEFLRENANEKGYINADLLASKDNTKLYFKLNTFKPAPKEEVNPEDLPVF
jgi:hypothetical protein